MKVYSEPIYELRSMNQIWYEGSWAGQKSVEKVQVYNGKFRGNTLVDVDRRPTSGILRYQRQNLSILPPTDVAPPMKKALRFVGRGH